MPIKAREAKLDTRTARLKLAARVKPYYRRLSAGLHLGYYRATSKGAAGSWVARRYTGDQKYETHTLGTADDAPALPADGGQVLTYDQAAKRAEQWKRQKASHERAARDGTAALTVRAAVEAYVAERKARAPKAGRDAELRLAHHVLGARLAGMPLLALTEADLVSWRAALSRGGRGKDKRKAPPAPLSPATLARLLNDLRAALSAAARRAKAPADLQTTIRDGLRAPPKPDRARPKQVLSDADVRKLVEAAAGLDPDFGALVMMLAATGARMDQVARVTVADFQPDTRRVMVPASRKGKGDKQITHIAVPLPDDVIARLRPLTAGRAGHEPLLMRWHHKQVAGDKRVGTLPRWERVGRRAWTGSGDMTRPWRATVQAAGLSADLVPYSLRHSSIVRGLRAGLPVRLVAAVHDTSAAMVEKHYGAFIVDASEDLLRRALVPMAPAVMVPLRSAAEA